MSASSGEKRQPHSKRKTGASEAPAQAIRWLEKILAASTEPAFFFEMQGHRLLAVNHKLVKLLGFAWDELLAKRVEDLVPMVEVSRVQKSLKQEPPPGTIESRYLRKDGTTLFVRLYYRDNWYLDSNQRERPIRLVVITKTSTSNLHELDLPSLPFAEPRDSQLRRAAWLKKLAIFG